MIRSFLICSSVVSGAISKMKSQTACLAHKSSISLNGLPVWLQRACTSSSQGWHSAGFDPSNIFILSNCLSNLAFLFSSAWASTPLCMVLCNVSANCVMVLCNASVMFVVFAFPRLTAFIIKDIAADRSDAGAEGATEAIDGGTGGGGKGIGKYG